LQAVAAALFPAPTPFNQVQWFYDPHIKKSLLHAMEFRRAARIEFLDHRGRQTMWGSGSRRLNVGGYFNTALTPGPGDPQARAPIPVHRADLL